MKITTVATETTYKIYVRDLHLLKHLRFATYQADAPRDGGKKRVETVHSRAPSCGQSLIATARLVELSNLILKNNKDGGI